MDTTRLAPPAPLEPRASGGRDGLGLGWLPWSIAALVLLAYVPLCPPVSGMGDSSELTLVLATGGIAHPTGYPLYTLFGHGFVAALHALGVGWSLAASLWSVAGAAVAFFFLAALAARWVGRVPDARPWARHLAPVLPLALFAVQPVVVGEGTRAEVNIWSLAWGCAASYVFVRLADTVCRQDSSGSRRGAAVLWGVTCGVGLAHHLTSVLLSVPLSAGLLVILARRRALTPSWLGMAFAAALLPLASDLMIAWRAWHPARFQWPLLEPSWSSVIDHLRAREYRGFLGSFQPSAWQRELLVRAVYPFLFPGLALQLVGLARAREAEERIAWAALLAGALAMSLFAFHYGVEDPTPYFLTPMALGVAAAAPAIAAIPGLSTRAGMAGFAAAALASLFVVVAWVHEAIEERAAAITFEQVIRSMWSSIPPDTAIVSWPDDRFNRLIEYQLLRGEKPALLIVTPDLLLGGRMRREILRRFGADPRQGFRPLGPAASDPRALEAARRDLVRRLNERVRVPVILFDPQVPIVWQYRKPWEPPGRPARPPASPHAASPPPGHP